MKVLMVVHQFLPRHLAGSEVYTYRLSQALRALGHDVRILYTEIRTERPQYELTRTAYEGIPCFEVVHNRSFASFRHTYRDASMEDLFDGILDEVDPDVVHIQHLHLHSVGYVERARRRGIPVVYTLHEYMLMCLRDGLLLRSGDEPCPGPEPRACARCASETGFPLPGGPAGPTVPPGPMGRGVSRLGAAVRRLFGGGSAPRYEDAVRERRREIADALRGVDLFLAPSRFLLRRFLDEGLVPPERIVHSDYGFHAAPFRGLERRRADVLRAGYVGTISGFKGVHVILDAFRGLDGTGIECRIYGDLDVFPDYRRRLLENGVPPAVRLLGRVENEGLASVLADLDLLIVPSLWYENSPLTIHEAFLAGVPVLVSDLGGMAELVEEGKGGLRFRAGDAADLRRQLLRVLREPGLLGRLAASIPAVRTIEEDAASIEERYEHLLRRRRAAV